MAQESDKEIVSTNKDRLLSHTHTHTHTHTDIYIQTNLKLDTMKIFKLSYISTLLMVLIHSHKSFHTHQEENISITHAMLNYLQNALISGYQKELQFEKSVFLKHSSFHVTAFLKHKHRYFFGFLNVSRKIFHISIYVCKPVVTNTVEDVIFTVLQTFQSHPKVLSESKLCR